MATWNYRVVRRTDPVHVGGDEYLEIHEVHYADDGAIEGISETSAVIGGDDVDEMRAVMARMNDALRKPTIDFDTREEI